MGVFNFKTAALAIVAGVGLGGCAYGPYGGLGVSVGTGYGDGYYDPYYGGRYYSGYSPYGYSPYGYSRYGSPYYGWYNGYYYPGTGYYVYDRYRRAHRWSDAQRRYWEWRQRGAPRSTSPTGRIIENWADFQQGPQANRTVVRQRSVNTPRTVRSRPVTVQQQQIRSEQRAERRAARAEARQDRRSSRGDRRRTKKD